MRKDKHTRAKRKLTVFTARIAAAFLWILPTAGLPVVGAEEPLLVFPMELGTTWRYEGLVRWIPEGSIAASSDRISWTMEVTDSVRNGEVHAVAVRGMVCELTWYEPGRSPGYSVLIQYGNRVYWRREESEIAARGFIDAVRDGGAGSLENIEPLLVLPLTPGSRWGGETDRDDYMYCWHVQDISSEAALEIRGLSPVLNEYRVAHLIYQTGPDHRTMDVAPGIGITRWGYVHHGTTASVDMRLVAYREGSSDTGPAD